MGVFQNNLMGAAAAAASAGGGDFYTHQIANSCRFIGSANDDGTNFMYHTRGTPTNADKCTISAWVKRSKLGSKNLMFTGAGSGSAYSWYGFNTANEFWHLQSGDQPRLESNAFFRDTSAWYHIVIANDSTQGTAANRNKVYINGVQYTDWGDYEDYSTQNSDIAVNTSGVKLFVGSGGASASNSFYPFDGYIAEYVFIDGTQYAASDFGETKNGAWIPKDPSGLTFGSNGAYLKFESSGDLGNDSSGNNNDFTVTGVAAHDQMLDSPTFNSDSNGGNFNTLNAVDLQTADTSLTEGNLTLTTTSSNRRSAFGTMGVSTGKWYFESRQINDTASNNYPLGIQRISEGLQWKNWTHYIGSAVATYDYSYAMYNKGAGDTSEKVYNDVWTTLTTSSAGVAGTIFQMAFDLDAGKIWFGINNTWTNSGNPSTAANPVFTSLAAGTYATALSISLSGSHDYFTHNYGQDGTFAGTVTAQGNADATGYGNFYYTPPTGFLALCAGNLPVADAVDPAQTDDNYPQKLFNTKLYTGTGSSNALTGVGFQPDWTWVKQRNGTNDYKITDSTRGVTKSLESNTINTEATDSNGLTAFGTDGFTVGSDSVYNGSSNTFLSWNWRANGGTTAANAVGGTASVTQIDPSGCFSIVTYTGSGSATTIGHGLSVAPTMIFTKRRNVNSDWTVYQQYMSTAPQTSFLKLSKNEAMGTGDSGYWNSTAPTSSVFSLGTANDVNASGGTYVAYCFANTEGYCKAGLYNGNASTDGTFVYTGFKPAWLMIKRVTGVESWFAMDDKRDTYNVVEGVMQLNGGNPESTTDYDVGDFLSNGFKLRISGVGFNGAETYIYLAFAENPFKYATAR
jgi:hypothetical protein